MNFNELLKKEFLIYDGGMGTMLQSRGLEAGQNPSVLSVTNANVITDIHREYVQAGSDIICTNTFSANRYKLEGTGCSVAQAVRASVDCCKKAVEEIGRAHV